MCVKHKFAANMGLLPNGQEFEYTTMNDFTNIRDILSTKHLYITRYEKSSYSFRLNTPKNKKGFFASRLVNGTEDG